MCLLIPSSISCCQVILMWYSEVKIKPSIWRPIPTHFTVLHSTCWQQNTLSDVLITVMIINYRLSLRLFFSIKLRLYASNTNMSTMAWWCDNDHHVVIVPLVLKACSDEVLGCMIIYFPELTICNKTGLVLPPTFQQIGLTLHRYFVGSYEATVHWNLSD